MNNSEILEEKQIDPEIMEKYNGLMVRNFLQMAMAIYVETEAPEKLFGAQDQEEWLKHHINEISEVVNHNPEIIYSAVEVAQRWDKQTSDQEKIESLRGVAITAVDKVVEILSSYNNFHEDLRP